MHVRCVHFTIRKLHLNKVLVRKKNGQCQRCRVNCKPVYTAVTWHRLLFSPGNRNISHPLSELKFILCDLQEHITHIKCNHPVAHAHKSNSKDI